MRMIKVKTGKHSNTASGQEAWSGNPVGLFWDQSLVWGILCVKALTDLGVPFHLLGADDIRTGCLERYRVLLVPGGWASHKVRVLGDAGRTRIASFIEQGGSYIGFCGGAGLALSSPPSLGLVPLERMPLTRRLPSASGTIQIRGNEHHPAWRNLPLDIPVSVWWPSQFGSSQCPGSTCVASYWKTGTDFQVADIPVKDVIGGNFRWQDLEQAYGINLDPERILGHPAILEVRSGRGLLILSYPHLETPGDTWGNRLLFNMLRYLDSEAAMALPSSAPPPPPCFDAPPGRAAARALEAAWRDAANLVAFGEQNLLWNRRGSWLLNWRRGIRGLEYGFLEVALRCALDHLPAGSGGEAPYDPWAAPAQKIEAEVRKFCSMARELLEEEKPAARNGQLSKLGKVNRRVDELRARLFGTRMNHGGMCAQIFDDLDTLLLHLLRMNRP